MTLNVTAALECLSLCLPAIFFTIFNREYVWQLWNYIIIILDYLFIHYTSIRFTFLIFTNIICESYIILTNWLCLHNYHFFNETKSFLFFLFLPLLLRLQLIQYWHHTYLYHRYSTHNSKNYYSNLPPYACTLYIISISWSLCSAVNEYIKEFIQWLLLVHVK